LYEEKNDVEDFTVIKIIGYIVTVLISGSYPLFGMYLKMQEKKFTKLFGKTDKLEEILPGIKKDIEWIKEELGRLRDDKEKRK
jgi:ethanolamine transporter EutH